MAKDHQYTDIVIVGNGPSAITLSYLLHGHRPYYNGHAHSDPILTSKLQGSKASIVDQDLELLSEGLEGRSQNPVALLWDNLMHPDADLGADLPPLVSWQHEAPQSIDHVVLGKTRPGGAWQHMEGTMQTLSQNGWMELPDFPFRKWISKRQRRVDFGSQRASTGDVRDYYEEYVEAKNLAAYFHNHHTVTGVHKVFNTRACTDCESGEVEPCCQNMSANHPFLWEVRGYRSVPSAKYLKLLESQRPASSPEIQRQGRQMRSPGLQHRQRLSSSVDCKQSRRMPKPEDAGGIQLSSSVDSRQGARLPSMRARAGRVEVGESGESSCGCIGMHSGDEELGDVCELHFSDLCLRPRLSSTGSFSEDSSTDSSSAQILSSSLDSLSESNSFPLFNNNNNDDFREGKEGKEEDDTINEDTGDNVEGENKNESGLEIGWEREEFCYRTPHVVLATGTYDIPNRLGIPGESSPTVVHSLPALERHLSSGDLDLSAPLCVVGAGLSAADAILMALESGIPVVHVFRCGPRDSNLIFRRLPSSIYPEYQRVAQLMRGEVEDELYRPFARHRLVEIGDSMVLLKPCQSSSSTASPSTPYPHRPHSPSPDLCDPSITTLDVSLTVVMIGARPNLSYLFGEGRNLGVVPKWPIDSKHNPMDVDPFSYQSTHEPGLFSMGPLVGDNFVRFGVGGALGIVNHFSQSKAA